MMLPRHANTPRSAHFLDSFPSSLVPVRVARALCDCPGLIKGGLRPRHSLCVCLTFNANFPFRPCLLPSLLRFFLPFRSLPMIRTRATRYSPLLCPPSVVLSVRAIALTSPLSVSSTIVSPSYRARPHPPTHARIRTRAARGERPRERTCGASEAAGGGGEVCGEQ